ncbi:MAG: hypothetical protein WD229_14965 [Pirellulales bacterium]
MVAHFRRLWLGLPSLSRIFWHDMLINGTAINLGALLVAFLMFAADVSVAAGVVVFLAPLPYNVLLVTAVWRSAMREGSEWSWPARLVAVAWLLLAVLI